MDTDNFFNSDDIMTSLLKKLSLSIKISVIKRYGVCLVSFKIVNRIRPQSSRIVFTPPTPTRQNSFVASAVCTHRRPLHAMVCSLCIFSEDQIGWEEKEEDVLLHNRVIYGRLGARRVMNISSTQI